MSTTQDCEARDFHISPEGTLTHVPATRVVKYKAAYGGEHIPCCEACARSLHVDLGKWLFKNDDILEGE